jgi:hypothetical protein
MSVKKELKKKCVIVSLKDETFFIENRNYHYQSALIKENR